MDLLSLFAALVCGLLGYWIGRLFPREVVTVWRDQPREPIGWTLDEIEEINANRSGQP